MLSAYTAHAWKLKEASETQLLSFSMLSSNLSC
jgi:hypothetical protein